MSESPETSDSALLRVRSFARQVVKYDAFWFAIPLWMVTFGLFIRFGMIWLWWAAAVVFLFFILHGFSPKVREEKRMEWENKRQAFLEKWSVVVGKLTKDSHQRYDRLHLRVSRLGDLHPAPAKGSLLRPGEYLLWLYLKLLLARDLLLEGSITSSEDSIVEQRDRILSELEQPGLTSSTRQSKEETVLILDQRLDTARNRSGRIQEIESDLTRIEQKLALMFDRAAQHNTMGDSGRRINFSDEVQTGASLTSLAGSHIEEMDHLVTAQVCA